MKKLAVFFLSLIFVLSACNSNNSKERITKENIKIDPKDSHYVIKENSENKPQKIKYYAHFDTLVSILAPFLTEIS